MAILIHDKGRIIRKVMWGEKQIKSCMRNVRKKICANKNPKEIKTCTRWTAFSRLTRISTVCDKRRLQTCRPTFFVTGLWANFIHPLFTVGESQSMSEANNSASGLQTQQCPIRQVTGNPCRGRLNIGRTVT